MHSFSINFHAGHASSNGTSPPLLISTEVQSFLKALKLESIVPSTNKDTTKCNKNLFGVYVDLIMEILEINATLKRNKFIYRKHKR